jgi:chromosome segregation ATPase
MSEPRETTQVVTSENQAEFFAQKLGLAPEGEIEAAEEAEPIESEVENEPDAEDEAPAIENEGKPSKLKARFSELTKQREQARADAQRERDAREALEARLAALEQGQAPRQAPVADAKPTPDQFTDAFEYAEALAEYSAERALKERDRQDLERRAQEQQAKVVQTWTKRLEAAKAEIDDFDDMVASDLANQNHEVDLWLATRLQQPGGVLQTRGAIDQMPACADRQKLLGSSHP